MQLVAVLAMCLAGTAVWPQSASAEAPVRLTLADAIQRGVQANLSVLLATAQTDAAAGTRLRRLSAALLPRVNAQTYANYQNRDLRAFGISLPGMPEVVGPFSNYDVRLYAQQNVFDLQSMNLLRASNHDLEASRLSEQDARDLIVRAVAALYLNGESQQARAEAAQSRVTASTTLLKLATDKHDAGTATGVDVLRAEVQLANDRQALLEAETQRQQALLALARAIGISPRMPIELAERLAYQPQAPDGTESLITAAMMHRADFRSLQSERGGLVDRQRANQARSYPKLSVNGNFGGIGRSVGGMQATGLIQGQIDFTLYDRDREGEAVEIRNQLRSVDDRIADLRRGIEEDVQSALLNLNSAAQQVDVAQQGQSLAERELNMAQDRFAQGTANNVEVVTAQDELTRAQENYIVAVSSHVDAKFALARALGDTEKNVTEPVPAP